MSLDDVFAVDSVGGDVQRRAVHVGGEDLDIDGKLLGLAVGVQQDGQRIGLLARWRSRGPRPGCPSSDEACSKRRGTTSLSMMLERGAVPEELGHLHEQVAVERFDLFRRATRGASRTRPGW